ncbi:MFS transporter [Candidatus Woesearchaeota archaeon]|nr:MFS transporter [Candidatus Woesearchaeota archaeon]
MFLAKSYYSRTKSTQLAIIALLTTLGVGAIDSIWSVYINNLLNDNVALVGLITGLFTFGAMLILLFDAPLLEFYHERKLYVISTIVLIIGYTSFFFIKSLGLFLVAAFVSMTALTLRRQNYGILVRENNRAKNMGEAEGLQYTLMNVGWLIGPLIGGFVAAQLGYNYVFLFATVFLIISFFLFEVTKIKECNHCNIERFTIKQGFSNLSSYFKKKDLVRNYFVSGGISMYWGILYIYVPLLIIKEGLASYWIGIALFSICVPLVLLEYVIGIKSDSIGFRKLLVYGYAIMALFAFLAFSTKNIYFSILYLALGSIGAACVEGTREAHFFKLIKKYESEKYYGPYNTHRQGFSTIGKITTAGVVVLFPLNYFFLYMSIAMLFFAFMATTIKKSQ